MPSRSIPRFSTHLLLALLPLALLLLLFVVFFVCAHRRRRLGAHGDGFAAGNAVVEGATTTTNITTSSDTETVRVYWTGGYDSSFRILQALVDEQKVVVPYYLAGDIDNSPTGRTRRRNGKMEQSAMARIRAGLERDFQQAATRLRPTVVVEEVPLSARTRQHMRRLHQKRVVRRPTCQYGSLGEYSLRLGQPIEVGVVRDGHSNAGIYEGLRDKVAGVGATCRVTADAVARHPEYALFRNCVFPLLHLDKPAMLRAAQVGGYDHLLRETWSCWYPTADDRPCNKCLMCKERIVRATGTGTGLETGTGTVTRASSYSFPSAWAGVTVPTAPGPVAAANNNAAVGSDLGMRAHTSLSDAFALHPVLPHFVGKR